MRFDQPIPIPLENDLVHSDDPACCSDQTCPDKEDDEAIHAVAQLLEDGLFTPEEATRFVQGRHL